MEIKKGAKRRAKKEGFQTWIFVVVVVSNHSSRVSKLLADPNEAHVGPTEFKREEKRSEQPTEFKELCVFVFAWPLCVIMSTTRQGNIIIKPMESLCLSSIHIHSFPSHKSCREKKTELGKILPLAKSARVSKFTQISLCTGVE